MLVCQKCSLATIHSWRIRSRNRASREKRIVCQSFIWSRCDVHRATDRQRDITPSVDILP